MNIRDRIQSLWPHIIIQLVGFSIALSTKNIGNLLIFLGLYFVTTSGISDSRLSINVKNIGRIFYIIGVLWSFTQPFAAALSWGSVFLTLFIGTFDFSKKLK